MYTFAWINPSKKTDLLFFQEKRLAVFLVLFPRGDASPFEAADHGIVLLQRVLVGNISSQTWLG